MLNKYFLFTFFTIYFYIFKFYLKYFIEKKYIFTLKFLPWFSIVLLDSIYQDCAFGEAVWSTEL